MTTTTAQPKITLDFFLTLKPISELSREEAKQFASKCTFMERPADFQLRQKDQDSAYDFYIVTGTAERLDHNGEVKTIIGGTESALSPLYGMSTHQTDITTKTDAKLIRVESLLLEKIYKKTQGNSPLSAQILENEKLIEKNTALENQLFAQINKDCLEDKLELPSLPDVALHIRQAVQDPNKGANDIAKIIQSDPAIASRLIHVAKSPLYQASDSITDCKSAIIRLGSTTVRDIVTTFSLQQLFKSNSPQITKRMKLLWHHSTHVASISAVLSKSVKNINPEIAMLGGLLHDIGTLAILGYAERYPELVEESHALDHVIDQLRGEVGAMILRKWEFPAELLSIPLEAENWQRDSGSAPDYIDIIIVAQLHSYFGTPFASDLPAIIETPAFQKLPISEEGPAKSLEILVEARSEVEKTRQLLNG